MTNEHLHNSTADDKPTTASAHTPGPWHWLIHDQSMASLGVGDSPGMGDPLVLSVGPCKACADRADPPEWKWGRCHTPSDADARLIAAAPDMLAFLEQIEDYLDGRQDVVDGDYGVPAPNAEMRLLTELRPLLARARHPEKQTAPAGHSQGRLDDRTVT